MCPLSEKKRQILLFLQTNEKIVFIKYYMHGFLQKELAELLNLTRQRIQQIAKSALTKVRLAAAKKYNINDFIGS